MKHLKKFPLFFALAFAVLYNCIQVNAAQSHTVTYVRIDGSEISSSTIDEGNSYGSFPSEAGANVTYWIDEQANIVQPSDIPDTNKTIIAIYADDISASGTMDSGNITWFIAHNRLFITGNGTLAIANKKADNASWTYNVMPGQEQAKYPSIAYDWLKAPAVGDELASGYGSYDKPAEDSYVLNFDTDYTISFLKKTISYPASALSNAEPWLNVANSIEEVYFSENLTLSGNFSYFFNPESTPASISSSVYSSLKNVYLLCDTSAVSRTSGMFAYCPKLENVFVSADGALDLTSCLDTSNMFYGDESLVNKSGTNEFGLKVKSAIDAFSNTGNVLDTRWMYFDCKKICKPSLSNFDMSSVEDASYMFTGCNSLQITCGKDSSSSDIGSWNLSKLKYAIAMFAGADIDLANTSNPTMTFSGNTDAQVVGDIVDLSKLNLSSLVSSMYMLANNHDLTTVIWSGASVENLENSANMLSGCKSLHTVNFKNLSTPALKIAVAMFSYSGDEGSEAILDSWNISALEDARIMFHESGFQTISFNQTNPSSLKNAMGMFWNSNNLVCLGSESLSNWTLPNLINSSYMFYGDQYLTTINVSNWDMRSAEDISYMVGDCVSLVTFNPTWNISDCLNNMQCFMYNCPKIVSFDLSKWNVSGVKNCFSAFSKMEALTSFYAPEWSFSNLEVCNGLFAYDYNLTAVDFGDCAAPVLIDAGGVFFSCPKLTTISVASLVGPTTQNISYFAANCNSLNTLIASNWDTSSVQYAQAFACDDESLSTLTVGNKFCLTSAISVAQFLKNCQSLNDADIQVIIKQLNGTQLEDLYEAFYNCKKLTNANLSNAVFSNATYLSKMFNGDDALTVITLPESFGAAVTSLDDAVDIFTCNDDSLTFLTIAADSMPQFINDYDWAGDNRNFLIQDASTINNIVTNSFQFDGDAKATATLAIDVTSSLYLNSTPASISYVWKSGNKTLTGTEASYSVSNSDIGSFSCTATITGMLHTPSITDTFLLTRTSGIKDISATYTGEPIIVGKNYSVNNVTVTITSSSGDKTVLNASEFNVSDTKVSKKGANQFTAYYTDSGNVVYSAQFSVEGKRIISSVEASYSGPDVAICSEFSKSYITMTAYYADDTKKKEGFRVTPSSFNTQTVTNVGKNTFTAFYTDTNNNDNTLSADFTVKGYSGDNIKSISASYTGPDVAVGSDYDKNKVIVTIHYNSDELSDEVVTDFSVSSTTVMSIGANSYEATFRDSAGTSYTATFSVNGVELQTANISGIDAVYNGPDVIIGNDYKQKNVIVTIHYSDGTNDAITTDFSVNKTTVSLVGTNSYEAYVLDNNKNVHTAAFTVTGLEKQALNISSVEASYKGSDIPVGSNYNKNDVSVSIFYDDGTVATNVTNFTVNSTLVSTVGANSYTATVTDSDNSSYTASFYVNGIEMMNTVTQLDDGPNSNNVLGQSGNSQTSAPQTGDSLRLIGWLTALFGVIVLLGVIAYIRFRPEKLCLSTAKRK